MNIISSNTFLNRFSSILKYTLQFLPAIDNSHVSLIMRKSNQDFQQDWTQLQTNHSAQLQRWVPYLKCLKLSRQVIQSRETWSKNQG